MTAVLDLAALLVVGAALVAAAAVLASSRQPREALAVLLEFLTAAGLLRLAGTPSWSSLLTAAVIIALRRLISAGLNPPAQHGRR
ncbi:MAG TPA: hypothetical protein VE709_15390 [Pseudonocardiaceae bacterium]|nr:hypothetical protein [Pseudonocardiaceae bacterium]